jgi:sortase A
MRSIRLVVPALLMAAALAGSAASADGPPVDAHLLDLGGSPTPAPTAQPKAEPAPAPALAAEPPKLTTEQACTRMRVRRRRGRSRTCFAVARVGSMRIPNIGVSQPVLDGWDQRVIDRGPAHLPGSAWPGGPGNAVIAGHRTSHSHPFLNIDRLRAGDRIMVTTSAGAFTYEVYEHFIVTPRDVWIAARTEGAILTIFACHPKRSARLRYVVRARLAR